MDGQQGLFLERILFSHYFLFFFLLFASLLRSLHITEEELKH